MRHLKASRAEALVIPLSLTDGSRDIDADRASVVIVYPDDTTGADLAEIIKNAAALATAVEASKSPAS